MRYEKKLELNIVNDHKLKYDQNILDLNLNIVNDFKTEYQNKSDINSNNNSSIQIVSLWASFSACNNSFTISVCPFPDASINGV